MTHVEVEARYRVEVDGLKQLQAAGITLGPCVEQDDQAYAPNSWAYGQPRLGVPFARLRTQDGRHLFTVKTPITDVRTCVEQETWIDSRDAMHEALLLMGFRPTVRIRKQRWSADLVGGWTLCLDNVEHAGWFIELEALAGHDDDHERIREAFDRWFVQLGIWHRAEGASYDTLVREAILASSERLTATAA